MSPTTSRGARELASTALLPHSWRSVSGCACGRMNLGESYTSHLVDVLDAAGFVLVRLAHRDHDLPSEARR